MYKVCNGHCKLIFGLWVSSVSQLLLMVAGSHSVWLLSTIVRYKKLCLDLCGRGPIVLRLFHTWKGRRFLRLVVVLYASPAATMYSSDARFFVSIASFWALLRAFCFSDNAAYAFLCSSSICLLLHRWMLLPATLCTWFRALVAFQCWNVEWHHKHFHCFLPLSSMNWGCARLRLVWGEDITLLYAWPESQAAYPVDFVIIPYDIKWLRTNVRWCVNCYLFHSVIKVRSNNTWYSWMESWLLKVEFSCNVLGD